MAALAPPVYHQWVPEDDLILKNAVEDGATLESLAKGAVPFSQRFTIQELRDRWHSLLYDPAVSAEASAQMIEFEHLVSASPSKSRKLESTKGNNYIYGKRKTSSVRNCYYARRKRIFNEPFDSMDMSFLVARGNVGKGNEHIPADCLLGDPMSNFFGQPDSDFNVLESGFSKFETDPTATSVQITAHALSAGLDNHVQEDLPTGQNSDKQISHTSNDNLSLGVNCFEIDELARLKELPHYKVFEADDMEAKPSTIFDQTTACSLFGGVQVYSSPISDSDATFDNFGFSSPLPLITIDGFSPPTMPDIQIGESKNQMSSVLALPDDGDVKNIGASEHDVYLDTQLRSQIPCDGMRNMTCSTDDYLAELSNTLFNFTDKEEPFFMDADQKGAIDKSYIDSLSSLLFESPNDGYFPDNTLCEMSVNEEIAYPAELVEKGLYNCHDAQTTGRSKQMPLALSADNSEFPELCSGVICCTLNVEDPDIPCNDDVVFPNEIPSYLSSVVEGEHHEADGPTSSIIKNYSGHQRTTTAGLNTLKRDQNNYNLPHSSFQMLGPPLPSDVGKNLPIKNHAVKFGLADSDAGHFALSNATSADSVARHIIPMNSGVCNVEEFYRTQQNFNGNYPEAVPSATTQTYEVSHAELGTKNIVLKSAVDPSSSDQENFSSEGDVPYFSDVEAMILDMDLSPDEQDLYSMRKVSRYQQEDTIRTIMRLEQSADASRRRAIFSQGAFAMLCGRRSRHYIQKTVVVIGRAASSVDVDIDLGREGPGNRISRRQAVIKMDNNGSFHLSNLGRFSIFVNGTEVVPNQSMNLVSGCLIGVRGMAFLFETNKTCIKQYIDSIAEKTKAGKIEA